MANFLKSLFIKGVEIDTTGASNGNVLSYNGTKFAPAAPGSGSLALNDLSDVVITSPEEFQGVSYNGTSWVNGYIPLVSYVRNAETTTLTTGTCVYLYGSTGDHATVKRADNTSDTTSSKTIGVVGASITASNNGPVITRGYVDGIDLSTGYTAGDVLWLGTNGAFTKTKPTAPDHLVFIGVVVRATNNGIIYVATQNGYELDEIHNVSLPNPQSGEFLKYNGSLWVSDAIDLGTDTTGSYVASLVAGTGISLANNSGEGATPTITNTGVTSINTTLTGAVTGIVTTADTGTVTSAMIADGTIVNGDINASAGIALSKLASGTSGQVVIANGTGVPTYTTISGDITISSTGVATIAADSVALGTDTTGNYMSGISGTSPVSVSHTPSEGSSATVSLASGYGDTQNPYASKTANYFLASPNGASGAPTFRAIVAADIPTLNQSTTGSAAKWTTARTITLGGDLTGSVSIDGSADATLTATVAANAVALGTDTTGNYVGTITAGSGLSSTGATTGEGIDHSLSLATAYGDTVNPYASKTANFFLAAPNGSAGVPTFRAVVAADIPTLNQSTTGNAATATTLQTSRNINGVAFNGSADITVTAAAGTLTGTTLASNVVSSSLTSVGTLGSLAVTGDLSVDTNVLKVDTTLNRVGINCTPQYALDVLGEISVTSSSFDQDGIRLQGRAGGSGNFDVVLTPATLSATRTLTLPDVTGTVITTGNLSSITTVGTLSAGSIPATLLTGTVASARISGSYTGITEVGTLTSLTINGSNSFSPSITLGDWNQNGDFTAIRSAYGYLLLGSANSNPNVYLRTETSTGTVILGGGTNNNVMTVGASSASVTGNFSATGDITAANYFMTNYLIANPGVTSSGQSAQWITAFNLWYLVRNSSTRSEKENIQPLNGLLTPSMIDEIDISVWSRIGASSIPEIGPMAEDMDAISPFLSTKGMDVDSDGNIISTPPNGINQNSWLSLLTVALQDAREQIKNLTDRLAVLESN